MEGEKEGGKAKRKKRVGKGNVCYDPACKDVHIRTYKYLLTKVSNLSSFSRVQFILRIEYSVIFSTTDPRNSKRSYVKQFIK